MSKLDFLRNWGKPSRESLTFLMETADPKAPLGERLRWFEALMAWIRTSPVSAHEFDTSSGALHNARLRFLLQFVDRNPQWREPLGGTIGSLLHDMYAFHLLCRAGLSRERGFLSEAVERIIRQTLPRPSEDHDLAAVFERIFVDAADAAWVANLSDETAERLVWLVRDNTPYAAAIAARWQEETAAAIVALSARVTTLGTSAEVLARVSPAVARMPYLALSVAAGELAHSLPSPTRTLVANTEVAIQACSKQTEEIFHELETSGASVGLVYLLDNIQTCLHRIGQLVAIVTVEPKKRPAAMQALITNLVHESVEHRGLRSLIRGNVRLVAKKITERNGVTGEHYIARNRAEYFAMMRAGIGGGVLMVFTTFLKFLIHARHLPLFGEFFLFSLNYSGSFLLLQRLGFTLATKQPSATASALAAKLETLSADGEIRSFVDEACRMARTQFASLLGNLFLLIPVAIGFDLGIHRIFGTHILSAVQAHGVVHSLDPIRSFTLLNAALTGVLLWMSSIAAGWLENFVVYRRLPLAIATHRRLRNIVGERRAKAIGDFLVRNASLMGGNVVLGFLMGAVSILGPFSGLPLDVRHVTLAAASLTFASTSLIAQGESATFLILPGIGVLLVGALNFAVAYSLAFLVATSARDLSDGSERRLLRAIRVRLRRRPGDFFLPRERGASEAHSS